MKPPLNVPRAQRQGEGTGQRTTMDDQLPVIYIARHGETAWTITGQHTGLTDLPLTPQGQSNARGLADRLKGLVFSKVFTSPLQRARQTCALAGFGSVAEVDRDLVEWNYGEYEGLRSAEIRAKRPSLAGREWCARTQRALRTSSSARAGTCSRLASTAGKGRPTRSEFITSRWSFSSADRWPI